MNVVTIAACLLSTTTPQGSAPTVDRPAPAFSVAAADGKTHALADYKGKFVVLEWTNRDCPVVGKHYESGNMQATQTKAVELGAVWLAICSSAPGKQGNLTIDEHNANLKKTGSKALTVLLDQDGKIGRAYAARTTPQIAIISPDGTLIYNGAIDDNPNASGEEIKQSRNYALVALTEAMAGKPVTTKTSRPYGCGVKY